MQHAFSKAPVMDYESVGRGMLVMIALIAAIGVDACVRGQDNGTPATPIFRLITDDPEIGSGGGETTNENVDASNNSERPLNKIEIGTPRHRVRQLLGRPQFESIIPSLRRVRECYADGTEVTFVEGKAISVAPGELVRRTARGVFLVELETRTVALDDAVLPQCGEFIPDERDKCAIENDFWFRPPIAVPTLYNGLHFTPPLANGPYVRAYLMQFGSPHFFWPQPGGHDWCPKCREWHFHAEAIDVIGGPRRANGFYYH